MMFMPVTQEEELKKKLTTEVKKDKIYQTKVIHDGGRPIHCGLRVKDPMQSSGCVFGDPNWLVKSKYQCDRE